jgi:xanthine dehydrogenase molybdopterin-binding subunit B
MNERTDTGYIGKSEPRPNALRLLQGRGTFVDDLRFPRLAHVVYFRSPYAHARIGKLDFSTARAMPGVVAVVDGPALAQYCKPWVAVLAHLKGIKSPPQHAIAVGRACWQGEAVAAVVAESRAQAEDAAQHIHAEWEELPVVTDMEDSLSGRYVIHPELGDNVCFDRRSTRRGRRGLRESRRRGRGDLRVRAAHRRLPGGTLPPRRLQRRGARAHGLSLDPGAAHDAGHLSRGTSTSPRVTCASWRRTSAARTASRSTSTPTKWRPARSR